MAENVILFPASECGKLAVARHFQTIYFCIGGQRYAFEFLSSVTEVNPVDATVLDMEQRMPRLERKHSVPKKIQKGEVDR